MITCLFKLLILEWKLGHNGRVLIQGLNINGGVVILIKDLIEDVHPLSSQYVAVLVPKIIQSPKSIHFLSTCTRYIMLTAIVWALPILYRINVWLKCIISTHIFFFLLYSNKHLTNNYYSNSYFFYYIWINVWLKSIIPNQIFFLYSNKRLTKIYYSNSYFFYYIWINV